VNPNARAWPVALVLALCSAGCPDGAASAPAPDFDAARAWKDLVHQVEIGPRPSGSEANETCRAWIEAELRATGLEPRRETFKSATPAGEMSFTNVWAELAGTDPQAGRIVIGSHFDTKKMARFVGANDGASSTAALLEIARVLAAAQKRAITYRFVFFDGEEAVNMEWAGEDNTYGSRHHAKKLKEDGLAAGVRAFVLLDMVGDKDLKITRDLNSDRKFVDIFFGAARRIGLGKHVDGTALDVRDDHLPFMAARIRSIDLIDLEYGPEQLAVAHRARRARELLAGEPVGDRSDHAGGPGGPRSRSRRALRG
jgi:hypothetical protein